ncbi:MAG: Fic family protein [bacterium]|nr:Fic family protein [bacterium]
MDKKLIKFLTDFIVESDAIEDIRANPRLVKTQIEEYIDNGHVGALLFLEILAQRKELLSEHAVRQTQGLITAEQHTKPGGPKLIPEYIGRYRLVNVSVGDRMTPPPSLVPSLMEAWISHLVVWQERNLDNPTTESLRSIARFHYEYEHIHPFVDGNGRSGRALVYYLLRYIGIEPFIFNSGDKHETYYRCFDDPEAMCRYFMLKSHMH